MTYETQEPKQLTKAQPWYASQPGRPSATRARSSYVAFAGSARLAARSSSTQPCHDMPPKTSWERTPATSPEERKANGSARMPPPTMVLKRDTVACVSGMAPPPLFIVVGALSLLFGGVMASLHSAAVKRSSSFSMMNGCAGCK